MPWNDLYGTARGLSPGIMYPVVAVQTKFIPIRWGWAKNGRKLRRYWQGGPFSAIALLVRLYRSQVRSNRQLILNVHSPILGSLAWTAKLFCPSMIVVVSLHGEWTRFFWYQRLSLKMGVKVCDSLITVSLAILESIPQPIRMRLMKNNGLVAIRNGIRSSELDNIYPVDDLPVNRFMDVVVVARIVDVKNPFFALRCFAKLKFARNLIWLGDGILRSKLEKYASELCISKRIHWLGTQPRDHVFEALHNSSVYLSCSKSEGIGVANFEAAALGCQPFLSDIGPHREIAGILDLETFPLDDENTWVQAIDNYLSLKVDERNVNAATLAQKTRSAFDLNNSVMAYIDVYREVVELAQRRGS